MQGSFWWKSHLKLVDSYKGMAKCMIGTGASALFWHDLWSESCLSHKFPHLYSFARNLDVTVRYAAQREYLEDLFHLPLSREAYQEFLQLEEIWDLVKQNSGMARPDVWTYIWGNSLFSSKKNLIMWWLDFSKPALSSPGFGRALVSRSIKSFSGCSYMIKNFQLQTYDCATMQCRQEETLSHLFWTCPMAMQCWDYVCPQRNRDMSLQEAFYDMRTKLQLPSSWIS